MTWATIWTSLPLSVASNLSTLWQVTCSRRVPDLRKLKLVLSESMWRLSSWFKDRHLWLYLMAFGNLQLLPPDTEIQKEKLILISFCWFRSARRWTTSIWIEMSDILHHIAPCSCHINLDTSRQHCNACRLIQINS